MNYVVAFVVAFVLIAGGPCMRAQDAVVPAERNPADLYEYLKSSYQRTAHATDPIGDHDAIELYKILTSADPAIFPVLRRLFEEHKDDQYRSAIIGSMFSVKDAKELILEFIGIELSKPPSDWHGSKWIFLALVRLPEIDEAKTRWAAFRALELEERFIRLCALGQLKKFGRLEDIARLEQFCAARKRSTPSTGSLDGILISAETAIDAIKARSGKTDTKPGLKETGGNNSMSSQPKAVDEVPATGPAQKSTWRRWQTWLLAGAFLATLLAFVFRRKITHAGKRNGFDRGL